MKKSRLWSVLFVLFCCLNSAFSQFSIQGIVYDTERNPLSGATVLCQEINLSATADSNGFYLLQLPANKDYKVLVSHHGYLDKTYTISHKKGLKVDFYLTKDEENLLETFVITGTRTPKLLKDAPIVTRVITAEAIEKTSSTNIVDLLQTEMPGLEFSTGMNRQTTIDIQGFGGSSVLFLVDGERMAGETFDNVDYNRLNTADIERVEIVKGAASSLYGSNAVGAVVNIITKKAKKPWSLNLGAKYGSHKKMNHTASVGIKQGKFNSMTTVQHSSSGRIEMKNPGVYDVLYPSNLCDFKERLIYKPTEKIELIARAGYYFRERFAEVASNERFRDFSGGLKGVYSFSKTNYLELSYAFDQYDKSDYSLKKRTDVRNYSNVQHSVHALYNHAFTKDHTLTVGGDLLRDYLSAYQFKGGNQEQYVVDVFAQFDWNILPNLNIISGLRFDYYSRAKQTSLAPKIGFMYNISHCYLRGSYAAGFRSPTLKELFMTYNMVNIFNLIGNPNLKAEYNHNFTLSAEYIRKYYNFTVMGFYNLLDNRITVLWDGEQNGMRYENMEKMNIFGAEVNASVRLPMGFSARAAYSYTYERLKVGNPLMKNSRPNTATLNVGYERDWKNYGFNLSLNGRVISGLHSSEYNAYSRDVEPIYYPAYTMWKLNLTQRVWRGIRVNATVDNLFNYVPDYYYNNSPATTGTTFSVGLSLDVEEFF